MQDAKRKGALREVTTCTSCSRLGRIYVGVGPDVKFALLGSGIFPEYELLVGVAYIFSVYVRALVALKLQSHNR